MASFGPLKAFSKTSKKKIHHNEYQSKGIAY
jgi:hypothetical protein